MVDVSESPAVPPFDGQGDERAGWAIAGGLLVLLGWGLAVALNLYLHLTAPAAGVALGPIRIGSTLGAFAWLTLALGLFTGAVGAGLLVLSRSAPKGPLVLPGYPYPDEPRA